MKFGKTLFSLVSNQAPISNLGDRIEANPDESRVWVRKLLKIHRLSFTRTFGKAPEYSKLVLRKGRGNHTKYIIRKVEEITMSEV